MQPTLVTGAGGFTGSNLCRNLVQKGYHVKALVRPGSSLKALENIDVKVIEGDISRDDGLLQEDFKGVDTVFHIAALFRQEGASRDVFHNVNVEGTRRVLECAKKAGVKRFIHCSTAGVHGEIDRDKPADEHAPFRPGDWYQETKLEGEQLALRWGQEHNLPVTVIRPSAICGPGEMRFLKLFRAIQHKRFFMIGNGEHHYHFVYVDDLAKGFIQAAENPKAENEIFIIAGPSAIPLNLVIEYICDSLGVKKPFLSIPVAPMMIACRLCSTICKKIGVNPPLYPRRLDFFTKHRSLDITKAKTILGYEPEVTPAEAITRMASWYRKENLL